MTNRLFVTEYVNLAETGRGAAQAPLDPPIAEQVVTIGASATQSTAFNVATRFILISTDTACSVLVGGSNPTALVTSHRMAADQAEFRGVTGGDKLSVIANP